MSHRMRETLAVPSIDELRRVAAAVGPETDCRLLVLFGSAARSSCSAPEDLDVAVLADGELDVVALTNKLIQALGTQHVDVADLHRADPLLMMLVGRDGVPLYERSPGEFARFVSLAARRYADTRKFRDMEAREIRDHIAAAQTAS